MITSTSAKTELGKVMEQVKPFGLALSGQDKNSLATVSTLHQTTKLEQHQFNYVVDWRSYWGSLLSLRAQLGEKVKNTHSKLSRL